jgi:hypothetical protein
MNLVKIIELWIERAEYCEKDKYAQAEDYREASVWRRAASELEIYMMEESND